MNDSPTKDPTAESAREPPSESATTAPPSPPRLEAKHAPWSAPLVLVTAWTRPAETARRTTELSALSAYAVHVVSAVVALLLGVILAAWVDARSSDTVAQIINILMRDVRQILREFQREPLIASLILAAVVAFVEGGYAMLALLVAAWGAKDESFLVSWGQSIKLTWLHTPTVIPLVLLVGIGVGMLDRVQKDYWRHWQTVSPVIDQTLGPAPNPPTRPTTTNQTSAEWQAYQTAMVEFRRLWQAYWEEREAARNMWERSLPWYQRFSDEMAMVGVFAIGWWFFLSLLRIVGARPEFGRTHRPSMCEFCGYELRGMAMESRCPECGVYVTASLGPEARQGTIWQRRRQAGRIAAWAKCTRAALFAPVSLGCEIRTSDFGTDHRGFFLMHLPIVFLAAAVTMASGIFLDEGTSLFRLNNPMLTVFIPAASLTLTAAVLVLSLAVAVVAGAWQRMRSGRSLLSAGIQVSSYLIVHLILLVVVGIAAGMAIEANQRWLTEGLSEAMQIDRDFLAVVAWLIPTGPIFLWYFISVIRATGAARFANR